MDTPATPLTIALLRGINVGGNKKVAMADLRDLLAHLGFTDSRTLLQSGNAVFRSEEWSGAALEDVLEREAQARWGLRTSFFVRTKEEWASIVAGNPFPEEAQRDPGHLVVVCLKDASDEAHVYALRAAIKGPEVVQVVGRQAYIYYPDGIGESKLTASVIDSKLGCPGTGRNWNTVLKLNALVNP